MKKKQGKQDFIYLGISDRAKEIFDHILENHQNINRNLHFPILASMSEACVRYTDLNQATHGKSLVVKSKNGETYIHPLAKLIKDERDEICRCASKLGLDVGAIETAQMGRPLKGFKAKLMSKNIK